VYLADSAALPMRSVRPAGAAGQGRSAVDDPAWRPTARGWAGRGSSGALPHTGWPGGRGCRL